MPVAQLTADFMLLSFSLLHDQLLWLTVCLHLQGGPGAAVSLLEHFYEKLTKKRSVVSYQLVTS